MILDNKSNRLPIGVIGAGAWGTAISKLLCINGSNVKIWCHGPETAKDINTNHTNSNFLPDIVLPDSLQAIIDLV